MPADPRTLVRLLDELVWSLRREGFDASPAQVVDIARAVEAVGIDDGWAVREAIAAVLGPRPVERDRFDAAFRAFFFPFASFAPFAPFAPGDVAGAPRAGTWADRLKQAGFSDAEIELLRQAIAEVAAASPANAAALERVLERGADLDDAVVRSGALASIDEYAELQLGFHTHRLLRVAGVDTARRVGGQLRDILVRLLGPRGAALAAAVAREIDATDDSLRAFARRVFDARVDARGRRAASGDHAVPFASLDPAQAEAVRRALRAFAARLRAVRRAASRRSARAPLDPHRTLRASLRTAGVPFVLVRRKRRRPRPKLVVLCDVSDSVRPVAAFLLELAYAIQELFDRARTFVFVSDVGETTALFAGSPVDAAIAQAWAGGGVISTADDSNYGRALRAFEHRHLRELDRRTTVVVLGDGRTNRHDAAADVLDRIRERTRALYWFCPEPRSRWPVGDSAMTRYAPKCTAVFEVQTPEDLERAVRSLVRA